MEKDHIKNITPAAMTAALYVVLSLISNIIPVLGTYGIRLSEILCVLPIITPFAIPGLFVGCIISNLISGALIVDIIFGSLTTLVAAIISYKLRKKRRLASLSPVICNTLVIPFILRYAYGIRPIALCFLTVFLGEFISAGILGNIFLDSIIRYIRPQH